MKIHRERPGVISAGPYCWVVFYTNAAGLPCMIAHDSLLYALGCWARERWDGEKNIVG